MSLQIKIASLHRRYARNEKNIQIIDAQCRKQIILLKHKLDTIYEIPSLDISIFHDRILSNPENRFLLLDPYGPNGGQIGGISFSTRIIVIKIHGNTHAAYEEAANRLLGNIGPNTFRRQQFAATRETDASDWVAPYWGLLPLSGRPTDYGLGQRLAHFSHEILRRQEPVVENLRRLTDAIDTLIKNNNRLVEMATALAHRQLSDQSPEKDKLLSRLFLNIQRMEWSYAQASSPSLHARAIESAIVADLQKMEIDNAFAVFISAEPTRWRHAFSYLRDHPQFTTNA